MPAKLTKEELEKLVKKLQKRINVLEAQLEEEKEAKINTKIKIKKSAEDSKNFFLYKNKKELKIVLTTVDRLENIKVAQIIQKFWQDIGIKVDLKIIDPKNIQEEAIETRDYEALFYGKNVGFDPDPYPFWHSSQASYPGLNLSLYSNKQADQLLEEARKNSDLKQRESKYFKFQDILIEDLPAIFLYNPTNTYIINKKIKGVDVAQIVNPADRFIDIKDWYVKTKRKFNFWKYYLRYFRPN